MAAQSRVSRCKKAAAATAPQEEEPEEGDARRIFGLALREANVLLTGAEDDDELCGLVGTGAEGAVLAVRGRVRSWRLVFEDEAARGEATRLLAKHLGQTETSALEFGLARAGRSDEPNHEPLGKDCSCDFKKRCGCPPSCRLVIIQPGKLADYAAEAGQEEALAEVVQEGRECSWADVLALVGKHYLCLSRRYFQVRSGPQIARAGWEGLVLEVPRCRCARRTIRREEEAGATAYVLSESGLQFAVQVPNTAAFSRSRDESLRIVVETTGEPKEDVAACLDALARFTPGPLKAALQKAIRFGARRVDLGGRVVGIAAFVGSVMVALFSHAGSFIPDLQLFSRGCTSAFKRLGVILFEDAWIDEGDGDVEPHPAALFAAALLSARAPAWAVPAELVRWATIEAVACARSRVALAPYREAAALEAPGVFEEETDRLSLRWAAFLIRAVRSFPGDERLVAQAAAAAAAGKASLLRAAEGHCAEVMPIAHIVDQHAFRGIGHLAPAGAGSFAAAFADLFDSVAGLNPRRGADVSRFEETAPAQCWRSAQRLCFDLQFGARRDLEEVAPPEGADEVEKQHIGRGALAGAVGSVSVNARVKGPKGTKRKFICTLGEFEPEEEVVMMMPSRITSELYATVTPEVREDVIEQVRAMKLPLSRVLDVGRFAEFNAELGRWTVDGEPWLERRQRLSESPRAVAWHPALPAEPDLATLVRLRGSGTRVGGLDHVSRLCAAAPSRVLLRALALLRQQHTRVKMPLPSLQGGKAANEAAVRDCDPEVYRLLLWVSCCVPGALRSLEPPRFDVPSSALLRRIEGLIAVVLRDRRGGEEAEQSERREAAGRWPPGAFLEQAAERPQRHQLSAVEDMLERDCELAVHAHFVYMDTGSGKTLTAVTYLRRLDEIGALPRYVLWTAPGSTVEDMCKTLGRCGVRAQALPIVGRGRTKMAQPIPYAFNVAAHDDLRKVVDSLVELADRTVIVVDEADRCYAKTLRTSAAHEIAALARKVICMTATPMRDTSTEGLVGWLEMCVDFPLTERNWWTAANSLISKQFDLGIILKQETVRVPFDSALRVPYTAALAARRWLDVARCVWDALDGTLVAQAAACGTDGVLLVARDSQHAERLTRALVERGVSAVVYDGMKEPTGAGIVVVRAAHCRGYNWAIKLGTLITGVYPGNAADRKQMVGRIRRIGQRRAVVSVTTVVMAGTIIELLHERHTSADTTNISLEALGERFEVDLLRMINP
jgi:hypothetical protein